MGVCVWGVALIQKEREKKQPTSQPNKQKTLEDIYT